MTRKQALQTAVEILSKTPGNERAAEVLKELLDEMPLVHWSDQSIRDTVEQFILDNGRVPTASDFRKKGMPSHTVIKLKYKANLSQWLAGNYPVKKETFEERKARHTENFIEDYVRIKPKSAKEFNRKKRSETVGWGSMVKYYGVTKWRELLKILNLKPYGDTRKKSDGKEISVRIHSDYNFKE